MCSIPHVAVVVRDYLHISVHSHHLTGGSYLAAEDSIIRRDFVIPLHTFTLVSDTNAKWGTLYAQLNSENTGQM